MRILKFKDTSGRYFPNKIKEARIARSMSLSELSKQIGVSSQAISQYELGLSNPSFNIMLKIINVLDFPINFFSNNINIEEKKNIVYFRSNKNITQKLKKACEVRINWIDSTYEFIEQYFKLPTLKLPNKNYDIESLDSLKIDQIAYTLREYWELGDQPLSNLTALLQKNGFVITKLKIGTKKVDAFSCWQNNIPYIFLGDDKNSAVRSRFDLAHELGHLILHRNLTKEDFEEDEKLKDIIEFQANTFAGALLLPRESFSKELITSSIDSLILLKRKWKVSISAMIMRIIDIDLLTDNQIKYLKSQMIKYRYYQKEPLDDILLIERPYLFKQAFEILIEHNIVTKDFILEFLNLKKEEAIDLYSLEKGFFDKPDNLLQLITN
ncbi:XRE family transcriptional regulator [uncultured Clostridium sp.]|uniref:helix-turn-helix domain-containing protein n=1 Tax=uncultured Clostridium sp. TaxID=59620 RepID=UPI00260A1D97|nr:XRE family transcriptional regulator [uncultured Clostridium sp.]